MPIETQSKRFPVRVWGMDVNNKPFTMQAHARDITSRGARLDGDFRIKVGDTIGIQCGDEKARFMVTWVGEPGSSNENCIGVQCVEEKYIWGTIPISLAASNGNDKPGSSGLAAVIPILSNRRSNERYHCNGGVDLRSRNSAIAVYTKLADISRGGCYLELLTPFATGEELDLEVNLPDFKLKLCAMAVVRTSHHMVGMGVEFTEIAPEMRSRLETVIQKLESLQSGDASFSPPPKPIALSVAEPRLEKREIHLTKPSGLATQPASLSDHTPDHNAEKISQLQRAAMELHLLELSLTTQDVGSSLLAGFCEALGHARALVTLAAQWMELQKQGKDPFRIMPAMTNESVCMTTAILALISVDVDALAINFETEGLDLLLSAVAELNKRLSRGSLPAAHR